MRKVTVSSLLVALLVGILSPARAQDIPKVELITSAEHGESPRLRDVPPQHPSGNGNVPLHRGGPPNAPVVKDPVAQTQTTVAISANSSNVLNFDGIAADGYIPPDTNLSVGDTQIVQAVNTQFAVFSKATGARIYGPAAIHTIFASLTGMCATKDGGDPIVLYDKMAGRWLISQMQYNNSGTSNLMCIAISQTSDATGKYNVYSFSFGNKLPDYPKFGVWPDGYYFSANMFYRGTSFQGAEACAFPRAAMLAGKAATAVCFQKSTSVFSLLPADLDGSTLPPAGEPNFFLTFVTNGLNLYRFHADFNNPSNSTFTGPFAVQGVAPFSQACGGGTCIPQPGVSQQLDSLGDRLMFRLAYRNFGSYEALVATHSVATGSAIYPNQTGIRWYEIRNPNGTAAVYQQSTFAPDATTYRWLGSIAQDNNGDIAIGYSVSDPASVFPGIRFTGRLASDPLNTLEAETTIIDGSASQTGSFSYRWGDYSSLTVDPADDCTFWYTSEYIALGGSFNWNTRIAAFKFAGCGAPPPPPAPSGLVATPGNSQITLAWNASAGAASYNVYRSNTHNGPYGKLDNVTSAGYTDASATNGTTYYYVVTALNSTGQESGYSNEATATPGPPLAPTGLAANPGDAQVSLSWNATANTTAYNVYRSVNGGTFGQIVAGLTSPAYTDTGLTNGTQYCYEVTAVNPIGEGAASSPQCATPQTQPPPAPTGLTATPGDTTVSLTWNSSTGAVSYNIYRSTTSGSGYAKIGNSTSTSYLDSGLTDGTTYYYVVTAVNSHSQESGFSNQASAKPTAVLVSITVTPSNPTIAKNTTLAFTATGNYSDGTRQNLTTTAAWSSSSPSVATISAAGVATGVGAGSTTITAASGGVNGSTTLFVVVYSISGVISGSGGFNATVKLSGAATATVTAGADGSYSFGNLGNGSYTVTPSNPGYTFTPANQSVTINGADQTGINFTSAAQSGITMDVNVAKDQATASSTITSPAFSTSSANELLLALVSTDGPSSATMTVTNVTGAGLAWSLVRRTNSAYGTAEIWKAFAPATLNNVSVTATLPQSVVSSMTIMSFRGVNTATPTGATGSGSSASGAPTASLTTTAPNSLVVGVGNDWSNAIARTVGPGQTLVHQYLAPVGDTYWVQRTTSTVAASGTPVTINDTSPTGDRYNLTICEIVAGP